MMKTIIILMTLALLLGFTYQVFVAYTTANMINTAVQRSVMTIASVNMPVLFDSLKEGSAAAEDMSALVTSAELSADLSAELGLDISDDGLVKSSESGGFFYRISGLEIRAENVYSGAGTVCFTADFTLEIPVAGYWDFGSFRIPMSVQAKYTNK